jgi:hypothetical protein
MSGRGRFPTFSGRESNCQTASLTPGPSFAHNLGYRCSNDQCEAIFYVYASRPFQWHQEHLNARCFGPCCRALNIRESRRTPNPHFFQVLGFTPTLGQSRATTNNHWHFKVVCQVSKFGQLLELFLINWDSWSNNACWTIFRDIGYFLVPLLWQYQWYVEGTWTLWH